MAGTAPKPFVFVLMPFDTSFDDVYRLGIKPAAEDSGAYCERIDEQIFAESILSRIYNQIAKADLIVADMTGRNPNVFYEVGYAHALGKTVILLTKNSEDIPFDLKHYPHIVYQGSISSLKEKLQTRVAHHLANPGEKEEFEVALPQFTISGGVIDAGAYIEAPLRTHGPNQVAFTVGVNNPHETVLDWTDLSVGLLLPPEIFPASSDGAVQVADKRFLFDLGSLGRLYPGAWEMKVLRLSSRSLPYRQIEAELRVFTPNSPLSIPFHLNLRTDLL